MFGYKKNMLSILLWTAICLFVSCNKVLEVKQTDYILDAEIYYSNKKQITAALNGVYSVLAESSLYGDHMQGRLGLEADEGFYRNAFDDNSVTYYEASPSDTKILNYWTWLYRGINRANTLMENLDRPKDMTEDEKEQVRGQALFLRGYFYFLLVSKFGGVAITLTATKSSSIYSYQLPNASVREVYEQILEDMTNAVDMVPDIQQVESSGRVSKSAIWAMLTRVNMYMAGYPLRDRSRYQEAIAAVDKLRELNYHTLKSSYDSVFIHLARDEYYPKETIWEVEFYGTGTGLYTTTAGNVGLNNGIENLNDPDKGYANGNLHPTAWLNSLYQTGDVRKDWNIPDFRYVGKPATKQTVGGSVYYRSCGKFRREYELASPKNTANTPQNAPIIRFSDVLLLYAEALNEKYEGPTEDAYWAINQVRRRAFGQPLTAATTPVDLSGYGYPDFRDEIKEERARELCFEGLRKDDLVRWNDFYRNMKNILLEVPTGTTLVLRDAKEIYTNASERDIIWPIPASELGVNKKLRQNSGW